MKAVIDAECQRGLEQLKGLLSHVDSHMTLGPLVGRLVQEGLDRHDPGRPRRGRRTCSAPAGADRTSAPKQAVQPAGTGRSSANAQRDAESQATSAPKRSAQPTGTVERLRQ